MTNAPESAAPDFSPQAREYAAARPTYPRALYDRLAALAPARELAWDCGTGSGQAARELAGIFERVVATDVSAEQLAHAFVHPRIEYRVAPAERSRLESGSVDLITAAAAAHWFDLPAFFAEAQRVARSGAVLAVWSYHIGFVDEQFDELFARLYWDVLRPYFSPRVQLLDDHYETLALPGEPLDLGRFEMTAEWTLDEMRAFIRTWSGYRSYMAANDTDPLDAISTDLESAWGSPEHRRTVRWPLYIRASRLRPGGGIGGPNG